MSAGGAEGGPSTIASAAGGSVTRRTICLSPRVIVAQPVESNRRAESKTIRIKRKVSVEPTKNQNRWDCASHVRDVRSLASDERCQHLARTGKAAAAVHGDEVVDEGDV